MLALVGVLGVLIGAAFFVSVGAIYYYMAKDEFREPFNVLCPETMQAASVRVDGAYAARTRFAGHEEYQITACSRWPEKHDCDRACSVQVPFLGDSRSFTKIAPYGLQPHQIRIFNPVRMTEPLYDKIREQLARQKHVA
jgi:hypothetical protein